MAILKHQGEISPNLYMIDTMQFNVSHITTVFCYYDGKNALLMDIGTTDNVQNVLRNLKKFKIPIEHLRGIALTHYHFDHAGGATKLWKKLHKKNLDFKIYTTKITKEKLQNANSHVTGATTTFGEFVGTMKPIPKEFEEEAFIILDQNNRDKNRDNKIPIEFESNVEIKLIPSPGHSPDHVCPAVFTNSSKSPDFLFGGEAVGTFYNETQLISASTSMPPNFQYEIYLESLKNIAKINPEILGVCHYGAISGKSDVQYYLDDQIKYMEDLRKAIIKHYAEEPSVRYVIEELKKDQLHIKNRIGNRFTNDPVSERFLNNLQLALTYGIMIDLGYRNSKYEKRSV
ncbi:MAG: MBL fold metallo-hydrolase [Candidatus Lokiarchaeota archaeon]|nr:MBL fold metallo-hydrolase [Candidatus Harpocratesius repetitus]